MGAVIKNNNKSKIKSLNNNKNNNKYKIYSAQSEQW